MQLQLQLQLQLYISTTLSVRDIGNLPRLNEPDQHNNGSSPAIKLDFSWRSQTSYSFTPKKEEVSTSVHPQLMSKMFTDQDSNRPPTPFAVQPIGAFYVFLGANILAALFAPIQDCDETFNYWEPTHYLSHGYGLQTWEYSPEYAIRSWLYVTLHAIIGNFRRILPFPSKVWKFISIRGSSCSN